MVVCVTQALGKVRPTCFARSLLFAASDSLEAGNVTKAGVQLREAATRYLTAMCEAHNCTPKKKRLRTPALMARNLRVVGGVDQGVYRWLCEIIVYATRCAHCRPVRVSLIETGISIMCMILDESPEINSPERIGGAI